MILRFVRAAEVEADKAADYYDAASPGLGTDFLEKLGQTLKAIQAAPERFPKIEQSRREIRRTLLRRFPYVVIFEMIGEEPVVLAVQHAHRKPGNWRRRRAT